MSTAQRRICVSICETDITALPTAIGTGAEIGDLVEVRLDCLDENDLTFALAELRNTLRDTPTIITLRPKEQGGLRNMGLDARLKFWREEGFHLPAAFFDLEVDLAEFLLKQNIPIDWTRVICSAHDFEGGADELNRLYERVSLVPARILKVAVTADDAVDNLHVFELIDRARSEKRELIAIGMGTAGIPGRILGPSRGSFLTYAAVNLDRATAPGQPTASELRNDYRIDHINNQTLITGVVGLPIAHSLSPQIHNAAFKSESLDAVYLPFEVRELSAFMKRMVDPATRELNWEMRGLSVTAPHKRAVMDHLDWIDSAAEGIGAVNTIVIDGEGLKGYNTDAAGFISPLKERFGDLRNARCAVIGGGGAASAAIWALLEEGAAVSVFVRDLERARELTERFSIQAVELQGASFQGFDIVVNTTVLGTPGEFEQQTPATADQLAGARFAYDLVYNPIETQFLHEAQTAGCQTLGGLPMFIAQAAEQFRLWTGREAPTDVMQAAAMNALTR